jgi:hypothetical protein
MKQASQSVSTTSLGSVKLTFARFIANPAISAVSAAAPTMNNQKLDADVLLAVAFVVVVDVEESEFCDELVEEAEELAEEAVVPSFS